MDTLDGAVAVVTGAASGIGLAVADALAAEGAHVVLTDLDAEAVERAAEALRGHAGEIETRQVDVRDPDALEAAADFAVERFGALHVAVNNAGIVNGGLAWELALDEWHRVIDVNLWGVIHGVRAFVPRIIGSGEPGHVVNVASLAAVIPQAKLGPYSVAKHGVLALSDVLRRDLAAVGAPVGVSSVMPGSIRTGMNPIGSTEPAAVAANVLDAIRRDRHYVYTDFDAVDAVNARLEAIRGARDDVIAP